MQSDARVFIVLVNWNGREVTLDCLRSLSEVRPGHFSIVVVDNASHDGSVEAIRLAYPQVILLPQSENKRFAGGNNEGMRYALEHGAEAVLLLNNDTTVDPAFLTCMLDRLHADPRTGMVVPKIFYSSDPQRLWYAGGHLSMWTGTMHHIGIRELDRGQYDVAGPTDYATGCCILVRREVLEKVGLLDESFFMYGEDADWCMRTRRAGFTVVYEPRARVWHKLSVSAGGHLSWFKMKNKFISNLRFFGRYASWYHWPFFPWMNVLVNAWAAFKYFVSAR